MTRNVYAAAAEEGRARFLLVLLQTPSRPSLPSFVYSPTKHPARARAVHRLRRRRTLRRLSRADAAMATLTQGCVSQIYHEAKPRAPIVQLIELKVVSSADPNAAKRVK